MRRSRSTSSCEYRRVPFGERWGSISPRASYMRSVCGCISASSAATEIMNTPRSGRHPGGDPRAPGGHQPAPPVAAFASRSSRSRGLPFIALRERLDRLALLVGEVARDVDHEAVVDVAALGALAEQRRALAAQALDRPVLGAAGHAQLLRAVQRRDLDVGAADRLGDRDRHLDLEVVALALEHRRLGRRA